MTSRIGWSSVDEVLMILRTSAVARCCTRASSRSRESTATLGSTSVPCCLREFRGANRRVGDADIDVRLLRCRTMIAPPIAEREIMHRQQPYAAEVVGCARFDRGRGDPRPGGPRRFPEEMQLP